MDEKLKEELTDLPFNKSKSLFFVKHVWIELVYEDGAYHAYSGGDKTTIPEGNILAYVQGLIARDKYEFDGTGQGINR